MTTGETIRRLYKEQGLTQAKLAKKAGIGKTTIQKVIQNDRVSRETMTKIANALGIDLAIVYDVESEKSTVVNAKTTGEKIGAICKCQNIILGELAEKAGLKNSTLSNIINERKKPRTDTLIKIAAALDMSYDAICVRPISELSAEEKIKRAYESKGMTQKDFARSLGMAQETIKSATDDVFSLRRETLEIIANALGLDMAEMYDGYEEKAKLLELPQKIKLLCRVRGMDLKDFETRIGVQAGSLNYSLYKGKSPIGIISFKKWAAVLEVPLDVFCNEDELINSALMETSVGSRIKKLREALGMTRSELVRSANVSHTTIIGIEDDIIIPKASILARVAKALNVSFDHLLYGI